jgi:carboxymethylenebutenolidase
MQTVTRRLFLEGCGVSSLCAQDWARQAVDRSPRRHEWVSVKYGARSIGSFVAYPQSPDKAPAIIVIHDVIAMAPWVENVADRLAEAGYLAITPDMLSGRSAEERQPLESQGKRVGPARRLPPA